MKALSLLLVASCAASARDMAPDRPDTTESPYTVMPGIFQVESTLWGYSRDGSLTTWSLAESNLKTGLTEDIDMHLVLRPWIKEEGGAEGFGDADVRLKWNLWGNDGGKTAGALMPFVTIPSQTAVSTEEWEGGLIFPVAIELSDKVGLGFQTELDRVWNEDDRTHDWDFLHSAVLGFDLTDTVGLFIEYVGVAGDHSYEATANTGLTFATGENVQWDLAIGFGLNDAAEDLSLIQGVSFRF
ncbi:MAG: transporter [Verrucomicrobiaceae bacterium]|nr:MAG: transporter [Verrucomicrobiaceae bacterium]